MNPADQPGPDQQPDTPAAVPPADSPHGASLPSGTVLGRTTDPSYLDIPAPKRPQAVAVAAVLATALVVVGGIALAVFLLTRSDETQTAVERPSAATSTPWTSTPTPTPTATSPTPTGAADDGDDGAITATQPDGYPDLHADDLSLLYCTVWRSTIGSPSTPGRWTPDGAVAYRNGYAQLATIAPPAAEMYLATLVEYYTLAADWHDPASATSAASGDAAVAMEDLRHDVELILVDSTIGACVF